MASSMTGFARVQWSSDELALVLTLRSVNHRFLDMQLRLPPELEPFDPLIRKRLRERVRRGQFQISASLRWNQAAPALRVNRPLIAAYVGAYREVAEQHGIAAEPDLNALLRLPGAVSMEEAAANEELRGRLEGALTDCLSRALDELVECRQREGQGIAADVRQRARLIAEQAGQLKASLAGTIPRFQERLQARLAELLGQSAVEPQRLLQEAALLADRSDISEELQRLSAHTERLMGLLEDSGELGKQIDFLAQEMNRETNTLLSKTTPLGQAGLGITEAGLRIKGEIEKIREQAQNLE